MNSERKYRGLGTPALISALQRTLPTGHIADPEYVTMVTLKALATRCQSLAAAITAADAALQEILDAYAPMLCDLPRVGTEGASQLLVTVGENPDHLGNEAQFAAREVYRQINPQPAPNNTDLRQERTRLGLTITTVARELGQWPSKISLLERGLLRNDTLARTTASG